SFHLARPSVVPTDSTAAEPYPLQPGLNALADRAPAGSPHNFPLSDGIYTGGYPCNSVLDGNLLYVAGTLSESGGTPSVCQGLINNAAPVACSRVKVIDTNTDSVVATIPVGLDPYGLALDKVPPGT